jgi:hypothetical protein
MFLPPIGNLCLEINNYSLCPIILDTFDKIKKIEESVRNLQKCPTRTSFGFE